MNSSTRTKLYCNKPYFLKLRTICIQDSGIMATHTSSDRSLRIITIVMTIPASILLIATGISTKGFLPTIGLLPMALSVILGASSLASKDLVPYRYHADMVLAVFLMAILVPTYVIAPKNSVLATREWLTVCFFFFYSWVFLASAWNPRMAMLCSYSVMPLMINL